MDRHRNISATLSWSFALILLVALDIFIGIDSQEHFSTIVTRLRLPRVLTAIAAGGGLALAGVQMQSILRNKLADPHIMGISSGASLGAAVAILAGGSTAINGMITGVSTAISSIIGAAAVSAVIIIVSRRFRSATTLLVFGVMLGFIVNAIITILQYSSNAESLKVFHSWSAGSFSTVSITEFAIMCSSLLIAGLLSRLNAQGLDIILFGDEFTKLAGDNPYKIRFRSLLSCCLITGAVTAFCGPIGFVGITAPHIARAFWKTSAHRIILPASLLCGGTIGVAADLISNIARNPIPVSSTMALVGIPVILYILITKQTD